MNSVFAMLNKQDTAAFQKGDIITGNQGSDYFGEKIRGNDKFHIIEVTGVTMAEAVALMEPMMNNLDGEDDIVYARNITVDVDVMLDFSVVTREFFLGNITTKVAPEAPQPSEVIV